ncbi:MAG: L,D-transpeptidase family protein [Pseudomonadota bacterium]
MNCPIVRCCSRAVSILAVAVVAACSTAPAPLPVAMVPEVAVFSAPVALPRAQAADRFTLVPGEGVVGAVIITVAAADDTLPDIARRFNVGYEEIVRANPGVDPWLPGRGREIVVPTAFVLPNAPQEGVVVNIAAMRLFYYPRVPKGAPRVVITHPIGIGKVGWKTPEGVTRIVARQKDPVWIPPDSVRKEHRDNGDPLPATVLAGPDNPLGAHLFRLGWPTYLIHGTNKPYGVGMRSSHGCLRLYPEDIAALFDAIPIGTTVQVVNQPTVLGWRAGTLYVQAFGPMEDDRQAAARPLATAAAMQTSLGRRLDAHGAVVDWARVARESVVASGLPMPVSGPQEASLVSTLAAAARVTNTLPIGASWNGRGGSLEDERQYAELLRERESEPAGR